MNAEQAHHLEETAVSLCLLEAHVTVAVAILQIGNQPADGEYAGVLRCQFLYATQHCVRAWDAGMRTLGKNVLQIQVEVFHAIATTAEHGEDGPYNLAVLIANQSAAKS